MAMFNKNEGGENKSMETVIGKSVKVNGNFHGDGNIIVEGEVEGTLKTSQDLTITETANIKASMEAANIKIAGSVEGNIKCLGNLEVSETGKIIGDIETKILAISAGAVLKGNCVTKNSDTVEKNSSNKK